MNCTSGGSNAVTAEVLTDSGWEFTNIVLPIEFYIPCMNLPALAEDSFFIIGRYQYPTTYVYNLTKLTWTRGPDLPYVLYGHSCGKLPTTEKSTQLSIIVAGGIIG